MIRSLLTLFVAGALLPTLLDAQGITSVKCTNAAGMTAVDATGKRFVSHFAPNHVFQFGNRSLTKRLVSQSPPFTLETEVDGPRLTTELENIVRLRAVGETNHGSKTRTVYTSTDTRGTAGAQMYEILFRIDAGRSAILNVNFNGSGASATLDGKPLAAQRMFVTKPGISRILVKLAGRVTTNSSGSGRIQFGSLFSMTLKSAGVYGAIGKGCGSPTLRGSGVLHYGQRFTLSVDKIPTGSPAVLMLGDSTTRFGSFKLPLPLTAAGAPGCTLYVGGPTFFFLPLQVARGSGSFSFVVPYRRHYMTGQGLVFDRKANALGISTTSAGTMVWTR